LPDSQLHLTGDERAAWITALEPTHAPRRRPLWRHGRHPEASARDGHRQAGARRHVRLAVPTYRAAL